MAKKHGGVRVGHKPNLSSSASAFARRGNPWVTEREGVRDFDRNTEIENPDMDADRQRHQSRERREKLRVRGDFKTTMEGVSDNPLDGYFAEKAPVRKSESLYSSRRGDHRKPDWGGKRKGVDFQVEDLAARRRRLASLSRTFSIEAAVPSSRVARVSEEARIKCPRCTFTAEDSRAVSKHIQLHRNGCCSHHTSCNCPDCRRARNDF